MLRRRGVDFLGGVALGRRASVCPPCAETYRADTYQLIRAGLVGGKGVPETVTGHPCVFATFTAPSFGPSTPLSGEPFQG